MIRLVAKTEEKYHFNHKYGFGVVNAQKAVKLAENWTKLPDRIADTTVKDIVNRSSINSTQTMSVQSDINFIEYVDIPVVFNIQRFFRVKHEINIAIRYYLKSHDTCQSAYYRLI